KHRSMMNQRKHSKKPWLQEAQQKPPQLSPVRRKLHSPEPLRPKPAKPKPRRPKKKYKAYKSYTSSIFSVNRNGNVGRKKQDAFVSASGGTANQVIDLQS